MIPSAGPVAIRDRIVSLDVLRGFALLGIALVNVFTFFVETREPAPTPLDGPMGRFLSTTVDVLLNAKIYPVFAFLFGVGLWLQWSRGEDATVLLRRRFRLLAALGAAHAILIWYGDILFSYGVAGLILLGIANGCPARGMAKWGLTLTLAVAAVTLTAAIAVFAMEAAGVGGRFLDMLSCDLGYGESSPVLEEWLRGNPGSPSYWQAVAGRFRQFLVLGPTAIIASPAILAPMLLGMAAAKTGWITQTDPPKRLLWTLPAGLLLCSASPILHGHLPWDHFYSARLVLSAAADLGATCLSVGYVTALARLAAPLGFLAPAGRMSLTNYLAQSVIFGTAAYGYGFAGAGRTSATVFLTGALALFAVQLAWSHWWLARFQFGPAEWAWRSLTYRRRLPLAVSST